MKRALLVVALLLIPSRARAVGEEINGFPSWAERVEHEWANRARVDPKLEMDMCGANCPDASCYTAQPPLTWGEMLAHAARFHSSEMKARGFFAHDSNCTLVSNIKDLYPATCKGETACACEGGMLSGSTNFATRVGLFGAGASGEIIAGGSDPNGAFYLWLYEHGTDATCAFSFDKGHRWLLLTSNGSVGFGVDGNSTGDFGGGGVDSKLASGSHYPKSGDVDLWTNWHDSAGPKVALVNVGGTCHPMTLGRGVDTNGAYTFHATGLSGCTRYYFRFEDSAGSVVEWPTTGSLGIGDDSCADFSDSRPPAGAGCDCTPSCSGKVCGDDGCGGSCGTCKSSETCNAGACVAKPMMDSGTPSEDGSVPPTDSGTVGTMPDAAVGADAPSIANDDTPDGDVEGSCGCRLPSRARLDPRMLIVLLFLLRRRPKHEPPRSQM